MAEPVRIGSGDFGAFVEIVKVPKECRKCGDQWLGNMLAGFEARDQIERTSVGRLLGWCDRCIDAWEAGLRLRNLQVHVEAIERGIDEGPKRAAKRNMFKSLERTLRLMADLAHGAHRAKLLEKMESTTARRHRLEAAMENAT